MITEKRITRRDRRELRAREWSARAWVERVTIGAGVLAVIVVFLAVRSIPETPAVSDTVRVAVEHLREVLERRSVCTLPQQREALLAEVRQELEELEPAVTWVLDEPSRKMFVPAAELAGDLRLASAVESLQRARKKGKPQVRNAAALALDAIEPLPVDEVRDLVESKDTQAALVGLQIIARRNEAPPELLDTVVNAVGNRDVNIARSALACLPKELDVGRVPVVLRLVDEPRTEAVGLELVGRLPVNPECAEAILQRLGDGSEAQLAKLLPHLQRYAADERVAAALWRIVEDGEQVSVRIQALRCIGAAGSFSLPPTDSGWPLKLRLEGARQMVAMGDMAGADLLLELAGTDPEAAPEAKDVAALARVELARIAGVPPHAGVEALRTWRSQHDSLPARAVPVR